jgi:predicted deacylase
LLVAGIHGTELMSQDLLQDVFTGYQPHDVSGTVRIVFCMDLLSASAGVPAHNPRDGKNPNRVWPGDPNGSYSERLAARVFTELVSASDSVIDLHGGEWHEEVVPFAIVPQGGDAELDSRSLGLARDSGVSLIETVNAGGAWLGRGTLAAESCIAGKCALAVEVGGGGQRTGADQVAGTAILRRMLASLGHIDGVEPPATPSRLLATSSIVRVPQRGVLVPKVQLGQEVNAGDVLAELQSFGGRPLEQIVSDASGEIMLRSVARVADEGAFVAKVGIL